MPARAFVLLLSAAFALCAQTSALPQFEVATVKLSPPPPGDLININIGRVSNGRVTFANASLSDCLKFAYGIVSNEQLAGPDWITSKAVRFDIVAQAPPETPREQLQLMLQALLAERLKLVIHHGRRELSYLALVPGKNGPKLREAHPNFAAPGNSFASRGHLAGTPMPMATLATLLSRFEREIVVDQTGLKGQFEVSLDWTPDDATAAPATDAPAGPSLFTAVQEQLGLRLERRKGPLDLLIVDHAEKTPTDN